MRVPDRAALSAGAGCAVGCGVGVGATAGWVTAALPLVGLVFGAGDAFNNAPWIGAVSCLSLALANDLTPRMNFLFLCRKPKRGSENEWRVIGFQGNITDITREPMQVCCAIDSEPRR